jgi:hypothetical protein
VHRNLGIGLWTDINNIHTIYEKQCCEGRPAASEPLTQSGKEFRSICKDVFDKALATKDCSRPPVLGGCQEGADADGFPGWF